MTTSVRSTLLDRFRRESASTAAPNALICRRQRALAEFSVLPTHACALMGMLTHFAGAAPFRPVARGSRGSRGRAVAGLVNDHHRAGQARPAAPTPAPEPVRQRTPESIHRRPPTRPGEYGKVARVGSDPTPQLRGPSSTSSGLSRAASPRIPTRPLGPAAAADQKDADRRRSEGRTAAPNKGWAEQRSALSAKQSPDRSCPDP
jgi:hypothetical protein